MGIVHVPGASRTQSLPRLAGCHSLSVPPNNAVFIALAMKWFQLCFVASVSSYAGIWVTTFGPR
jgi:hypothetical protein